jgi:DNA-binding LacI/PurR family transcriptional regulator
MSQTQKTPKYHAIRNKIRERIKSGALLPGAKLPPERIIAEEFGVSRLTVRTAISRLLDEEILYSIHGSGTYVSKSPLGKKIDNDTIHVICSTFHDDFAKDFFATQIIKDLCACLALEGKRAAITLISSGGSLKDLIEQNGGVATFKNGVVFVSHAPDDNEILFMQRKEIPHVCLTHPTGKIPVPRVESDDYQAIRDSVNYLINLGYERVAFLEGPTDFYASDLRRDAYRQTLQMAGLEYDENLIIDTTAWNEDAGRVSMETLLDSKVQFSAVIVSGDFASLGALRLLKERGIKIPDNFYFFVFDWYPWLDTIFENKLPGMAQDTSRLANEAINMLETQRNSQIGGARRVVVPQKLIRRN